MQAPTTTITTIDRLRVAVIAFAMLAMMTGLAGCRGNSKAKKNSDESSNASTSKEPSAALNKPLAVNEESSGKEVAPTNNAGIESEPKTDEELRPPRILVDTRTLRHEVRHRGPLDLHPDFGQYRPNQYRKDHTLFVLAFDSVTRQNYFLIRYQYLMSKEQRLQAMKLVESYNDRYDILLDQRNEILEVANDQMDIESLLVNNKVETLNLSREIRRTIHRKILNREQRAQYQKDWEEQKAQREKAKRASEKKITKS